MKKNKIQPPVNELTENNSISFKWIYWILGLFTFFVFANSINNGYNLDDEIVTRNHPLTSQGLKAVGEIISSPYYQDDMGYAYGYRPMVHVSFAIEHELFGEKPEVSHFFNVLLYVFSGLLFFKFLHLLFGEKHLSLIVLGVLFFVVHPVHSEVVASIKNRDELLGFLFAMLSVNRLLRFIQKENSNWWEILLAVILLFLAMLSKKSIYPLVFIFPLAVSLFSSVSWRTFLLSIFVLVLPVALVASELVLIRFLILSFAPIAFGIFSFYFLVLLKEKSTKILLLEIMDNKYFLIGLIALMLLLTAYLKNRWFTFLIIPFFFLLIKKHRLLGISTFSISCLLLNLLLNQSEYALLSVIFTAFLLFQELKEKSLNKDLLLLNAFILAAAITLQTYQEDGFNWGIVDKYFALYFFLFLRHYRLWLAILLVPLVISVAYFIFGEFENGVVNFFLVSLVIIASHDAISIFKRREFINTLLILICVIGSIISFVNQYQFLPIQNNYGNILKNKNSHVDIQNKGEGRSLEYVENTLVAPHSKPETIATGLSTLGEYFRLMIFPKELSFYYGYSKTKTVNITDVHVIFSLLVHLGLMFIAVLKLQKSPTISFGIFWYLASILLFSNWVELVAGMVGERLAFTASAGFSIFFSGLIFWIKPDFNWRKPKWVEWSVLVVLILFATRTVIRNSDWKNAVTLMSNDIKHLDNSAQANNLLALNLAKHADEQTDDNLRKRYFKKAQHHFKRAFEIYPPFGNAYYDYARASMILGENQKAVYGLKKSIKYNPTFNQPYIMLCEFYELQKDFVNYERVAKSWIQNAAEEKAYISLARVYFLREDFQMAFYTLEKGRKRFKNSESIQGAINELSQYVKQNEDN